VDEPAEEPSEPVDEPAEEPSEPVDEPSDPVVPEEPPPAVAVPDDAAEVVAVDLPTEMECGETLSVSVEMRNTGSATWSRAGGYKLGAIGDDDPLYGPDVRVWLPEDVLVPPGDHYVFHFELEAPSSEAVHVTDWQMVHEGVRWFGETTSVDVEVICSGWSHCDPLTSPDSVTGFSAKEVSGGSFTAGGWQTTGGDDQLVLELEEPLTGSARIDIDVTNFDPLTQYSSTKHQIFNAYTSDDGSQDVFDTDEAWWNIRTGTNYGTGFKFLAAPNGGDSREESRHHADAAWDPAAVHRFSIEWDAEEIDLYLNDELQQTFDYSGRVQPLQYIFIGTDNVYVAQVGPIYSNLCVTHAP